MDKIIDKLLTNPYTRSLSILVFILIFASIGYFTLVNAESSLESSLLTVGGSAIVFGSTNPLVPGLILNQGNLHVAAGETKLNKLQFVSVIAGNNSTMIRHYEIDESGIPPNRFFWGDSDCNPVVEGSKDDLPVRLTSADFNNQTTLPSWQELIGVPTAQAENYCFLSFDDCDSSGLGCISCHDWPNNGYCGPIPPTWYCDTGGGGEPCDPLDCHDAACGFGYVTSTPSLIEEDFCSGSSGAKFKTRINCTSTQTAAPGWLDKIEFRGSPDTLKPTEVEIFDNFIANENKRSDCGYEASICPDDKFMAGWRTTSPQVYCCEL